MFEIFNLFGSWDLDLDSWFYNTMIHSKNNIIKST